LSTQRSLLWSTAWDQPNDSKNGINTTPSWFYEIWNATIKSSDGKKDFYALYKWHYFVLVPMNKQVVGYDNWKHTLWIHPLYINEYNKRLKWINSNKTAEHRNTHGCPNVYPNTFGELFNHLDMGSTIYITNEK
jgi:hypothetical protein